MSVYPAALLAFLLMEDRSENTAAISAPDTHLEKIGNQAIVSYLKNGSFWVLVDCYNSLYKKRFLKND